MNTTRPPLYFLHIHKTAGSTFTDILNRQFAPETICPAQQWHQLFAMPLPELGQYQLFRGHFHYCFHTLLPTPPLFMTFLRHPVERSISRYLHLRRDYRHYLYPIAHSMSLRQFLHHPLTRAQVHNLQVRHLAFDFDIRAIADPLMPLTDKMEMEAAVNQLLSDLPDDSLLDLARERLNSFAFVGITERFQESLAVLAHRMNWAQIDSFVNLNVSQERMTRDNLEPDLLEEIFKLNEADLELYQFGLTLLEQRIQKLMAAP